MKKEISYVISKVHINCKYCDKEVEGYATDECLLEMIYHVHDVHTGVNLG